MNVLYLGMADDIMAPLLLVPELTTLFAIDLFDPCFSIDETWEGQKEDIKQILTNGNDKNSLFSKIRGKFYKTNKTKEIYYLKSKSIIIEDIDNENVWKLKFIYDNIERQLIYYHHQDFYETWPNEINNITHIMTMGAEYWPYDNKKRKMILQMLHDRTTDYYYFYALSSWHEHFPIQLNFISGAEDGRGNVARLDVNKKNNSSDWLRNIFNTNQTYSLVDD